MGIGAAVVSLDAVYGGSVVVGGVSLEVTGGSVGSMLVGAVLVRTLLGDPGFALVGPAKKSSKDTTAKIPARTPRTVSRSRRLCFSLMRISAGYPTVCLVDPKLDEATAL